MKFTLNQAWDMASVAEFYCCGTLLAFRQSIKATACPEAVEINVKGPPLFWILRKESESKIHNHDQHNEGIS
jgi:hypothetical protein